MVAVEEIQAPINGKVQIVVAKTVVPITAESMRGCVQVPNQLSGGCCTLT